MRIAAIAVTTLLTVLAVPGGPDVADAASTPVQPLVVVSQDLGGPVVVQTFAPPFWTCTVDNPPGVSVDVTVSCDGSVQPAGAGACTGLRVGAQSGDVGGSQTVSDLIAPIIAPPPAATLPGASTLMQVSAFCGGGFAGVSYMTPGADAATSPANWDDSFLCVIHVDDALAAQPWNAFCYGNQ